MPIVNILKRAILGHDDDDDEDDDERYKNDKTNMIYEDNEVLFCKNNVCVHPPAIVREESDVLHYPGYLTVTTKTFIDQYNNVKRPTLFLAWIPNTTLRKCPTSIENSLVFKQTLEELKFSKFNTLLKENNEKYTIPITNTNPFLEPYNEQIITATTITTPDTKNCSDYSETVSISSKSSDKISTCNSNEYSRDDVQSQNDSGLLLDEDEGCCVHNSDNHEETPEEEQLKGELQPLLSDNNCGEIDGDEVIHQRMKKPLPHLSHQQSVTSVNITISNPRIQNVDISPENSHHHQHHVTSTDRFMRSLSTNSNDENNPNWMTPELFAFKHNLSFPESVTASPIINRKTPLKCRRFSVDLSQMRALRLFFNDENCTSGQLVIASRESQYKILHFHHGGLDHLAQVLHQWHCLLHNIKLAQEEPNLPYRQFMVCRPEVRKAELHPEEGNVSKITTDYFYGTLLNAKGQIDDDLQLRKCVFFGGLEKSLRKTVWPFLLHCYSTNSTFEDRAALAEIRRQEYEEITRRRLYSMSPETQAHFWRTVQCVIEKDVVRTDRGNPFFSGDNNPNIETMKNVLLNYAFYNPGMS